MSEHKPLETLSDYIAGNWGVWIKCGCGRIETRTAEGLLKVCREKGLSERIAALQPLLRCSRCRKRAVVTMRGMRWR